MAARMRSGCANEGSPREEEWRQGRGVAALRPVPAATRGIEGAVVGQTLLIT